MTIKLPFGYDRKYYNRVLSSVITFCLLLIVLKTCTNGFDVTTGARAMVLSEAKFVDTPKQKPIFIPAIKISTGRLALAMDSINQFFISEFGKEKTVTNAELFKQFYYRQIQSIFIGSVQDSLVVNSKK